MENNLKVINEQEVLGKQFKIYGTFEEPLFLAKDVAEWIDYSKDKDGNYRLYSMVNIVDDDEKLKIKHPNNNGVSVEQWFLTEDGLYEVLMQSRKPIAKQFKKEVKRILKQIRMTGGYIPVKEEESELEILSKAFLIAQRTLEAKDKLIEQKDDEIKTLTDTIEEQKPNVNFAKAITTSDGDIKIGDFAKMTSLGQNKLFEFLRENKILMKNNLPYQTYIDRNYFTVTEVSKNGKIFQVTLITPKGQHWILNLHTELIKE